MDAATTTLQGPKRSVPSWITSMVIGRHPKWTLIRLVLLMGCGLWIYLFTPPIRVTGISMEPTFTNGRINFVNRLAYVGSEPKRGDVVGVGMRRTAGNNSLLLKRIVALPGEKIAFEHGHLYINDRPMDEPYVKYPCDWEMEPKQLGPHDYYVVGDNRSMDISYHTQGIADRKQIVGRILF